MYYNREGKMPTYSIKTIELAKILQLMFRKQILVSYK